MILSTAAMTLEVTHRSLYVCFRGREVYIRTRSGMPLTHASRDREAAGTRVWAIGLEIVANRCATALHAPAEVPTGG